MSGEDEPAPGTGPTPLRPRGAAPRRDRPGPVFLERQSYRRRRLIDAIRLAPVLGVLMWAVPLMWTRGETASSAALLYLFGGWALLVLAAGLLSWAIRDTDWAATQAQGDGDSG